MPERQELESLIVEIPNTPGKMRTGFSGLVHRILQPIEGEG